MDIDAAARKIREALMDRIEMDRCIHASSIEDVVSSVLRASTPSHQGRWATSAYTLTTAELPCCVPINATSTGVTYSIIGAR